MTRKCSISEILTSYFLTSKTCPFSFLRFWFSSPWHLIEMSSLYISIATKSLTVLMVSLPFPLNLHQFLMQTLNLHFLFFFFKSNPVQNSAVTKILLSQLLKIPHQNNVMPPCRWGPLKTHVLQPELELYHAGQSFTLDLPPSSIPLHSLIIISLLSLTIHPHSLFLADIFTFYALKWLR